MEQCRRAGRASDGDFQEEAQGGPPKLSAEHEQSFHPMYFIYIDGDEAPFKRVLA
jgi:hypothetical protein